MTWGEALENINFTAVILGAVASLVMGAVWYAQSVFGKQWAKLVGLKKKDMEDKAGMPIMMAASVVFYFVATLMLAAIIEMTDMTGFSQGALMGAIVGFAFGFGPMAVSYVFARRAFELTLVDGGYIIFTLAIIGGILGYWQ